MFIECQNKQEKTNSSAGRNKQIYYYSYRLLLLIINRSNRQNTSKGIVNLKGTINQLGIVDIYRVLHAAREEYYSWAYNNHSSIQAILRAIKI